VRRKHSFRFSLDAVVSSRELDIRAPLSGEIFVTRDRDACLSSRRLSSPWPDLFRPPTSSSITHRAARRRGWPGQAHCCPVEQLRQCKVERCEPRCNCKYPCLDLFRASTSWPPRSPKAPEDVDGRVKPRPSPAKGILGCVWIAGHNHSPQPDSRAGQARPIGNQRCANNTTHNHLRSRTALRSAGEAVERSGEGPD
jgi:hypothetical protein